MSWIPPPQIGAFFIYLFVPMLVGFFAGFGVGSMFGLVGLAQWSFGMGGLVVGLLYGRSVE